MSRVRQLAGMAILFVAYAVTARLGLTFDAVAGVATPVWPPTGISLAALVLFGPQLWPGITLAAFLVNAQTGVPLLAAAGMATGNTLEALAGAWLLRRTDFNPTLTRVRDAIALVVLAGLLSTLISATVGATSLWLSGAIDGRAYRHLWWVWWVGDVGGDVVVAPLLLAWFTGGRLRPDLRRAFEAVAIGTVMLGLGLLAFRSGWRAYIVFPALLWAALRFGPRGGAAGTLLTAAVAVAHTASVGLVELQLFIAVMATTTMVVAAAVAERAGAVTVRDEFLSVASHELRTPVAALRLRIDGMNRLLAGGDPKDKIVTRASSLGDQVDRLEKLIDELLDVSRITAGRLHLEPAPVKLAAVVRDAASRFPAAGVSLELDEAVGGVWDRVRIEQVVTNLIGNAVRHGAPPIRIVVRQDGARARLIVSDAGPGVPTDDRRRVFERFEQRGGKSGGLGLGLYITRQIVQAHGGTVTVAGATFTVDLPSGAAKS